MQNKEDLKKRYEGCMIGLAVGDALGAPLEFLTRDKIIRSYGGNVTNYVPALPNHFNAYLTLGQYTDDTQLSLELANSLIEKNDFDPEDFAKKLAGLYKRKELRSSGKATREACKNILNGTPALKCGVPDALGSGTAMRAAPLGLFHHLGQYSGKEFLEAIAQSTLVTHNSYEAFSGTAAVARGIMHLKTLEGKLNEDQFLEDVMLYSCVNSKFFENDRLDQNVTSNLKKLYYLRTDSFRNGVKTLGNSGLVTEVVPLAFLAFLKSPEDFERTISNAASYGGDADTIASISGALSGAYNGIDKIPTRLKDSLENYDKIKSVADKLFDSSMVHHSY